MGTDRPHNSHPHLTSDRFHVLGATVEDARAGRWTPEMTDAPLDGMSLLDASSVVLLGAIANLINLNHGRPELLRLLVAGPALVTP
jgi:hypothetical protein